MEAGASWAILPPSRSPSAAGTADTVVSPPPAAWAIRWPQQSCVEHLVLRGHAVGRVTSERQFVAVPATACGKVNVVEQRADRAGQIGRITRHMQPSGLFAVE